MKNIHTILVGGGINNLVCASLLAKAGKKVLLLESSAFLGGCIRSHHVEGCTIDTLSTAYPLFVTSPAYAALKEDLTHFGVEFVANNTPTASVLENKKYVVLSTDREKNSLAFNQKHAGDGDRFAEQMQWVGQHAELFFLLLGEELRSKKVAKFFVKYFFKHKIKGILNNIGQYLSSARNDLPKHFKSAEVQALFAPWILHTGLSPDSTFSAVMAKIVAMTVEMVGLPMVKGGSYKIVEAFKSIIERGHGECKLHAHVDEILIHNNGAVKGVRLKNGETYEAKNVVASVNPTQLYLKLLKDKQHLPQERLVEAENYQYGMGNMQIHLILNEPPAWYDEQLKNIVYVHLSNGIDDVSQAVGEAKRQLLPQKATICIAQPSSLDPSRAAKGKHILWIQLPECPNYPKGDAANKLNALCQQEWNDELKTAYANRILDRIEPYISNIKSAVVYKEIISPKELSQLNINLRHGDPYSGACDMDQYLFWRPFKSAVNHQTPIKNLYHNGASTHPGPGLGGAAGVHIANRLKKK